MRTRPKLYFAAPLFSPIERSFNERLAGKLSEYFDVFLPQRDGILLPGKKVSDVEFETLCKDVFESDMRAIKESSVTFGVIDGRTVDEGVSVELGIAYALEKTCVGFYSDSRVLLPQGMNPMLLGVLSKLLRSESDVDIWLESLNR